MSPTSGVDRELRGRVTVSGSVALARCQERDVGVSAGFTLSTRSRPDGPGGRSRVQGVLGRLSLTSQGGLEVLT